MNDRKKFSTRRLSPGLTLSLAFATGLIAAVMTGSGAAQTTSNRLRDQQNRGTERLADNQFRLAYKYQPGQHLQYQVTHLVTVKTTVQKETQENKSRSRSIKSWEVTAAEDNAMSFIHKIDAVDMWSETTGKAPVSYNSETDSKAPLEYEPIAETVGKPLSEVTIDPTGQILKRSDESPKFDMGTGGLVVPLPKEPIEIGGQWEDPGSLQVRNDDGTVKEIKTRMLYELKKVETGVATISIKTQVLTPDIGPRIRSQLIQRLSQGEVKFDIDAGCVISKTLDWDETVIGFSGAESNMSYLSRWSEKLVDSNARTAARP